MKKDRMQQRDNLNRFAAMLRVNSFRLISSVSLVYLYILPKSINVCPFYLIFDIPCPLCGLCRSIHSLLHFDVSSFIQYHPLGILIALYLIQTVITNNPSPLKYIEKKLEFTGLRVATYTLFGIIWFIRII